MKNNRNIQGFTLLEILLVVAIIAILSAIVIVALNPSKMLANARNVERKSDLKQINSALQQYYIDHREYPITLSDTPNEICYTGSNASSTEITDYCNLAGLVNLSVLVPVYLPAIPKDPQASVSGNTGYHIVKKSKTKISLVSASAELNQKIVIGISDITDDPCEGKEIGDQASSSTAICAGEYSGFKYMTTPNDGGQIDLRDEVQHCEDFSFADYDDWYLPSKTELNLVLYNNKATIGNFIDNRYWSSTKTGTKGDLGNNPWWQDFTTGDQGNDDGSVFKKLPSYYVRCVRSY